MSMKIALMVGKFSPLHEDHLKSILGMKEWADENGAEAYVYSAMGSDAEKQPLPFDRKMYYVRKAVEPHGVKVCMEPTKGSWDAMEKATYEAFSSEGEKGVYVFTGSDRIEDDKKNLESIKKRYEKKGRTIDFPMEVIPSKGRVGGKGLSATDLRNAIRNDDYDFFKKHTAMPDDDLARQQFDEYRMAMYKVEESKHQQVISRSLRRAIKPRPPIDWGRDPETYSKTRDSVASEYWRSQDLEDEPEFVFNFDDVLEESRTYSYYEIQDLYLSRKLSREDALDDLLSFMSMSQAKETIRRWENKGRIDEATTAEEVEERYPTLSKLHKQYVTGEEPKPKSLSDQFEELKIKWHLEDESERFRRGESKLDREFGDVLRESNESVIGLGKEVVEKLKAAYPEAKVYFIGGTARDFLSGMDCNDVDIALDVSREDIMKVFPDVVSANRFGDGYIVIIDYKGQKFDLDSVVGLPIEEKIIKGDLTFNCMAVDPVSGEVIDPENGEKDLESKTLRFSKYVFDLLKRGAEARSVLRPFKFQSRWGWDFDAETIDAMEEFVAGGYNFNRVQPNNMQKIVDAIRSGPHAAKALKNIEELGLNDVLKSYDEKRGTKLAEAFASYKGGYDPEKWKNFRTDRDDPITDDEKDELDKGYNRRNLGGYFDHECKELLKMFKSGKKLNKLAMEALRKNELITDEEFDTGKPKKGFFKRVFEGKMNGSAEDVFELGKSIVAEIKECGNFAYFVGGAARDHILGKTPNDVDLITDMSESFLQKKFAGRIGTAFWRNGHQIIIIEVGGEEFEVSRLPRSMKMEEELANRDLTMNAIAWDPTTDEYVDPTGGRDDLSSKTLEFTPFTLDAVSQGKQPARVIRAFRFVATTGFDFGEASKESLKKYAEAWKGRFGVESAETLKNNWGKFKSGKFSKKAQDYMEELGFGPELEAQFG